MNGVERYLVMMGKLFEDGVCKCVVNADIGTLCLKSPFNKAWAVLLVVTTVFRAMGVWEHG